jgi:serine/threonine protein kinase
MKVFIQGKGSANLSKNAFLASGGQADVYVNGHTAYKIYNDKQFIIPSGKIKELSALTYKNIIKPEDILLDQDNNVIGYTMQYVNDTYTLCQLFPRAFRDRNSLSNQLVLDLIRRLQDTIKHCHDNKILIVDLNEMNFLVAKDFREVFAIDVDSWNTPHYPATAIMDSIRDHQVKHNSFTENSDWFSFGILAFSLFSAIHPYKGVHKIYKTMDERMEHNISVLNKDVKVPKVCLDFNTVIPEVYRNWFKSVFDGGKRSPPPTDLQITAIVNTVIQKISGSDNFNITELEDYVSTIVDVLWGPVKSVLTSDGLYINKVLNKNIPTKANFITLPKSNAVVAGWVENRSLKIINATKRTELKYDLEVQDVFAYDNRLYIKAQTSILEIQFNEIGTNIIPTSKVVAQVLEHSSLIFDGCVIQSLLGATYVSIFPKSGEHYQFHTAELDKLKIVDAKFDRNVLMVLCNDKGKYNKYIFRFDILMTGDYDLRILKDVQYQELNFTVLDTTACVHILGDGELEIFSSKKDSKTVKEVVDPVISGDIKIFRDGAGLLFSRGSKIYSMKMK